MTPKSAVLYHKIKAGLSAVVKTAVENNDVFSTAVLCMNDITVKILLNQQR